jgi:hypothetical protein
MEEKTAKPGDRYKGRQRSLCDNVHAVMVRAFGGSLDVSHVVQVAPDVRTRLYTLQAERQVTAEDVVYALLCFARGEKSSEIAERFRDARMSGLSRATLQNYANRLLEDAPDDVPALLRACTPPGRYDRKLSRILVEDLEACTKASVASWRTWTLLEIMFFVRTGKWPPRAVWAALPDHNLKEPSFLKWQDHTREICGESGVKPGEDILQDWEELQDSARSEKVDFEHKALAPDATREAVRVALLYGARPQENTQKHGCRGASSSCPHWMDKRGPGRPKKNR